MKEGRKKYSKGINTGSDIITIVAGRTNSLKIIALMAIMKGILITNRATRADSRVRMRLLPTPPLPVTLVISEMMVPAMGIGIHSTGTPPVY